MFQPKWQHNSKEYRSEYCAWCDARRRCYSPNNAGWKNYGGRGIQMCDRWRNDFDAFMEDMGRKPEGTSLERKNNDGNYEPDNCIWATRAVQSRNKQTTVRLTFNGVTQTAAEWADQLGIARNLIFHRTKRGYPIDKILSKKSLVPKPRHGTISMYAGRKCRCDRCRKANSEYTKALRKSKCPNQ